MRPIVHIYRLGRTPYVKALNFQTVLFNNLKKVVSPLSGPSNVIHDVTLDSRLKNRPKFLSESDQEEALTSHNQTRLIDLPVANSLILVEHEPVYTVGLRTQSYDRDYVASLQARLKKDNLEANFVHTNRGGLITFHGPGQLVAYPILYLGDFPNAVPNMSVKAYVKKLEDVLIETLSRVGVDGAHTVLEYPGVWLENGIKKIAFVGITCQRHVTMHGISINCDCDLSWFDHIVSCGIENKLITSIKRELYSRQLIADKSSHDEDKHLSLDQGIESPSPHTTVGPINTNQSATRRSGISGPTRLVQEVANAFCLSFSRHFDCELLER